MWANQAEISPQSGYVTCARFSPDCLKVAFCTTTGYIEVRKSNDLSEISSKRVHSKSVNEIRWSENSELILSCSDDGTLILSRASDLQKVNEYKGHHSYVLTCDISTTNLRIASGSYDESVRIWDTASGKCLRFISAHSEPVSAVSFSKDTKFIISSSWDGLCRQWDSFSGTCIKAFQVCQIPIAFSTISPNDQYILASSNNSIIKLIRISDSTTVALYRGHQNTQFGLFASFAINEEGNSEVFSPSESGEIIGWDLNSQDIIWRVPLPDAGPTLCADVSRRGNLLIAAGSTEKCHSLYLFSRGDANIADEQKISATGSTELCFTPERGKTEVPRENPHFQLPPTPEDTHGHHEDGFLGHTEFHERFGERRHSDENDEDVPPIVKRETDENASFVKHETDEHAPIVKHESKENAPTVKHESNENAPIVKHESKENAQIVKHESKENAQIVKHETKENEPIVKHETKENAPIVKREADENGSRENGNEASNNKLKESPRSLDETSDRKKSSHNSGEKETHEQKSSEVDKKVQIEDRNQEKAVNSTEEAAFKRSSFHMEKTYSVPSSAISFDPISSSHKLTMSPPNPQASPISDIKQKNPSTPPLRAHSSSIIPTPQKSQRGVNISGKCPKQTVGNSSETQRTIQRPVTHSAKPSYIMQVLNDDPPTSSSPQQPQQQRQTPPQPPQQPLQPPPQQPRQPPQQHQWQQPPQQQQWQQQTQPPQQQQWQQQTQPPQQQRQQSTQPPQQPSPKQPPQQQGQTEKNSCSQNFKTKKVVSSTPQPNGQKPTNPLSLWFLLNE